MWVLVCIGRQYSSTIHDFWRHWFSPRDTERGKFYVFWNCCLGSRVLSRIHIEFKSFGAIIVLDLSVLTCRRCDICSGGGAYVVRCVAIGKLTRTTTILIFGGCKMNSRSLCCASFKRVVDPSSKSHLMWLGFFAYWLRFLCLHCLL